MHQPPGRGVARFLRGGCRGFVRFQRHRGLFPAASQIRPLRRIARGCPPAACSPEGPRSSPRELRGIKGALDCASSERSVQGGRSVVSHARRCARNGRPEPDGGPDWINDGSGRADRGIRGDYGRYVRRDRPCDGHPTDASKRDILELIAGAGAAMLAGGIACALIDSMNPSKDVLAVSSLEVDLAPVALGHWHHRDVAGQANLRPPSDSARDHRGSRRQAGRHARSANRSIAGEGRATISGSS